MIPNGNIGVPLSSKSKESYPRKKGNKNVRTDDDSENVHELISELEKVEAWIFSRIVESLWWQVYKLAFSHLPKFLYFSPTEISTFLLSI